MAGGEFSETDLAGMGEDWYKHLRKTVRLVKKQSEAILREAKFRERSWKFEE